MTITVEQTEIEIEIPNLDYFKMSVLLFMTVVNGNNGTNIDRLCAIQSVLPPNNSVTI